MEIEHIKKIKEAWESSKFWTEEQYNEWYKNLTLDEKNIVRTWELQSKIAY